MIQMHILVNEHCMMNINSVLANVAPGSGPTFCLIWKQFDTDGTHIPERILQKG